MMLTEAQIDCAVEWWKNVLENPKFDTLGETRGQYSDDEPAAFAEVLATGFHKKPKDEVLDKFADILRSKLKQLDADADWFNLGTDYHPDKLLNDAYIEALGSSKENYSGMLTFPWKTMMWFRNGGVQVSYGYGAPAKELLLDNST